MPYTLHGSVLSETAKAMKFEIEKINEDTLEEPQVEWFPFSQIKSIMKSKSQELDNITVSDWIMDAKGLL
jgi:hypothetical protein